MDTELTKNKLRPAGILGIVLLFLASFLPLFGQSGDQNRATPITTNEIEGRIQARDIGDSRLTDHFYTFDGNQGDVFINVVTQNLDGDIDLFTVEGLRPLTKITIYSDLADRETGRVVYLRKFEKLLMRIQGRSPNDEPAIYRIKFAGSFVPAQSSADIEEGPSIDSSNRNPGKVLVNSVGTIIEAIPSTTPIADPVVENPPDSGQLEVEKEQSSKEINITSVEETTVSESSAKIEIRRDNEPEAVAAPDEKKIESDVRRAKPVEIITDTMIPEDVAGVGDKAEITEGPAKDKDAAATSTADSKEIGPVDPKQLANIQLIIRLKDGRIITHSLNKVFSFNVNQGILRIVLNDGTTTKYSMLEVEKVSIEESLR